MQSIHDVHATTLLKNWKIGRIEGGFFFDPPEDKPLFLLFIFIFLEDGRIITRKTKKK
jgi:hypothetical protein